MALLAVPNGRQQHIIALLTDRTEGLTTAEIAASLAASVAATGSAIRECVRAGRLGHHPVPSANFRGHPPYRWYALDNPLPPGPKRNRKKSDTGYSANPLNSEDAWMAALKASVKERQQFATQRARV